MTRLQPLAPPRLGGLAPFLLASLLWGCPSTPPSADGASGEPAPGCDPLSCPGCCLGQSCRPGDTVEACGTGGLPCVICPATELCSEGQCLPEGPRCTPASCPTGCCLEDECQAGSASDACGKGGQKCTTCASTQSCVDQVCGCSPATCKGCCEAGVCRSGTTAAACGSAGQPCKKCLSDQGCLAGVCTSGGSCSSASCAGCCEGTLCKLPGLNREACGLNGQPCRSCAAAETCVNGICNNAQTCSSATCPNGCCQDSTCRSGLISSACGKGGGLCAVCLAPKICKAGGCVLDPSSQWGITVVSAEISTAKTWDWPFYPAPDAYVVIEIAGLKGNTSNANETYTPSWNEYLFAVSAGVLTSTKMLVTVYDDDLTNDQVIGTCWVTTPEAVLLSGAGIIEGCGTDVKRLELKYTLQ